MKNILFIFSILFMCCATTSVTTPAKLPKVKIETAMFMLSVKEDVKQLTLETQELIQFMRRIISLHESGIPVRILAPIDSLSIDFGVTNPSGPNKAKLRAKFRIAAQIVKDKMDELLAIVPE